MLLNGNWTPNGIVLRECQYYDGILTLNFHQYTHIDNHKIFIEVMGDSSDKIIIIENATFDEVITIIGSRESIESIESRMYDTLQKMRIDYNPLSRKDVLSKLKIVGESLKDVVVDNDRDYTMDDLKDFVTKFINQLEKEVHL